MGLGPPRGHLVYWRRQSALQPGRSAWGSSPESSLRSCAMAQLNCWGSGLRLTQCCQSNPGEERLEKEECARFKKKNDRRTHRIKEWEVEGGERTGKGEILCQVLDLLPLPSAKINSLKPVATFNYSGHWSHSENMRHKKQLISLVPWV